MNKVAGDRLNSEDLLFAVILDNLMVAETWRRTLGNANAAATARGWTPAREQRSVVAPPPQML